ncbi:hypothetical protein DT426_27530 [Bacillus cereus]|uniref:hypothetical protein n=1 Tax=Bacillus cereus TaxID=1396 RepID=UPI000FD8F0D9|nr:hypothetical protein [Bacillus cereus]AZV69230.1 hypothetical protein DT426_27530 [Bacillus cereus]
MSKEKEENQEQITLDEVKEEIQPSPNNKLNQMQKESGKNIKKEPSSTEKAIEEKPNFQPPEGDIINKTKHTIEENPLQNSDIPKSPITKTSYSKNINKTINAGDLLEYRMHRLLFHMGYFSKVGIELKTSQEEDSEFVTDLDVYGIYINKDFRYKTVWADCKSGRAKPLERISWMKGIRDLHDIDDILFVKSGVKSSIKHFARKSDIQVLDLSLIERLEKDFSILSNNWSGPWNPNTLLNKLKDFSKLTIPNNETYKKIAKFISSDYWSTDKYTRIKKCITAFKELSAIPLEDLKESEQSTVKWAIYELTSLFVLALLNVIRELYYFSDYERQKALHDGMVSGEISIKKRTELISASYRLAFELMRAQQPDLQPPAIGRMVNISPPSYFEALDDLISRIIHNPLVYFDILRVIEYMLMEYDLQNKDYDWDTLNKMFENINENVKGIKTILHFICQITGISKNYYKIIR